MVGSSSPFCNDSSHSPTLGCSISSWHILYIVCKLFSKDFWLVTSGRLWERNFVSSLYIFERELMKGNGFVSWDSFGCECSKCVSYVFICISLCFIIQFMFISVKFSELDKVEFNFIALPVGKFHVQCFSSVEKDSYSYAHFALLNNLSIFRHSKLNCYTFCLPCLTK